MTAIYPIAFMDAPQILVANVTNIPGSGSAPLQIIANLGLKAAYALDYIDTTGDFIGVYIGAPGFETLLCIIGNGETDRAWAVAHANSRISLRSMTSTPITNGSLSITFMGVG